MDTNKRWTLIFLIAALSVALITSLPIVQKKIASMMPEVSRTILAKVSAFYGASQTEYLILKVKDGQGLQIEIFTVDIKTHAQVFKQKFNLSQDSDAYVTIDKNSANLALSDIDKDNQLDILAPSVDRNGNLRLNTFRFNPELNSFEEYSAPENN